METSNFAHKPPGFASHTRQTALILRKITAALLTIMSIVPRIITALDVQKLLSPNKLLPVIEKALGNFSLGSDGGIIQPIRTVIPINRYHG